jgi:hypothetical protein
VAPSYRRGHRLTEGRLYRRIPNWAGFFDDEAGQPEPLIFQPREKDQGCISTFLIEDEARASLESPQHEGFGLCVLDVEKMIAETGGAASAVLDKGSHVRIHGCDDEYVQLTLAAISDVLIPPAKPYRVRVPDG